MTDSSFVHLRVHSHYSLSEGAIRMDDLVACAREHAMPAIALTDTNSLSGCFEFNDKMQKNGIKPVLGCQLDFMLEDEKSENPHGGAAFLVGNKKGYHNLSRLCSRAHIGTKYHRPLLELPMLESCNEGVFMLSGGSEGPLGRVFFQKGEKEATLYAEKLARYFPDRFYIELQRHNDQKQKESEAFFVQLALEKGFPLLATNQCFFPNPDFHEAHDILLCVSEGVRLGVKKRRRVSKENYLKSPQAMRALFSDLPEACDNSLALAMRCNFLITKTDPKLPVFCDLKPGKSEAETLIERAKKGLEERLSKKYDKNHPVIASYYERLDYELEIIGKVGFSGYFLIIADIIRWARNQDIPVGPGRGSGAGSLSAWALCITDIDPIEWGLLFERFLNPERLSMPDFDIDFCVEGRDRIIKHVKEVYGADRVAQIITFGTLQARACLRDVGRVISMPYSQVDQMSKMIPTLLNVENVLSQLDQYAPPLAELEKKDPQIADMLEKARKLEGLYRHASTHAAGIVISAEPIEDVTPLYRDPKSDMPATQFTMKYVERTGLVKFDFLGLKTLSIIRYCVDLIATHGKKIAIDTLPLDDPATFKTISSGHTFGLFQLESKGMRDVLVRMKPDRFSDLIAALALYRPGPMENIPSYIKRKHGAEKITYLHEKLQPILEETYGIPVYQEQVMQMAQILADYTLGGADKLRRAMGKKNVEEMKAEEKIFLQGTKIHNIDPKKAKYIFTQMQAFAGYGFNKSHAAAYAVLAYQTAWLKTHYPTEFIAASMQFDIHNTDRLALYRDPIKQMKLDLLLPDINRSEAGFSVEINPDTQKHALRYALGAIRNMSISAMKKCVAERKKNGTFNDLFDFIQRCSGLCNRRMLENLMKSGACDSINNNRKQNYLTVPLLLSHANSIASNNKNQINLFDDNPQMMPPPPLPNVDKSWTTSEALQEEVGAIGFYLSSHPLENWCNKSWNDLIVRLQLTSSRQLQGDSLKNGQTSFFAGSVEHVRKTRTKTGKRMMFVTLSDPDGVFEIMLFEKNADLWKDLLKKGNLLCIKAALQIITQEENTRIRLKAEQIQHLAEAFLPDTQRIQIHLSDEKPLQELKTILEKYEKKGNRHISLAMTKGNKQTTIDLPHLYHIDQNLYKEITMLSGVIDIRDDAL